MPDKDFYHAASELIPSADLERCEANLTAEDKTAWRIRALIRETGFGILKEHGSLDLDLLATSRYESTRLQNPPLSFMHSAGRRRNLWASLRGGRLVYRTSTNRFESTGQTTRVYDGTSYSCKSYMFKMGRTRFHEMTPGHWLSDLNAMHDYYVKWKCRGEVIVDKFYRDLAESNDTSGACRPYSFACLTTGKQYKLQRTFGCHDHFNSSRRIGMDQLPVVRERRAPAPMASRRPILNAGRFKRMAERQEVAG